MLKNMYLQYLCTLLARCVRIVIDHVKRISEPFIGEEKDGVIEGRDYFTLRYVVKKVLEKKKVVFAALIELGKVYEAVHRKAVWKILTLYDVYGRHFIAV